MSGQDRRAMWHLLTGFTVWSVGFVGLYALQTLGCEYGWSNHRLWLILAYALIVAVLSSIAWITQKAGRDSGLATAALWANRSALAAGVVAFLPVTFATTCI